MLVLSRKSMESIQIGDNIEIIVLQVAKNRVRLGLRCPTHLPITRQELQPHDPEAVMEVEIAPSEVEELLCV